MYEFVFVDNQYWGDNLLNNIYRVTMKNKKDITKFKKEYKKMMDKYWNNEICWTFYEDLADELEKHGIDIYHEDNIETYRSIMD